MTALTTRRPTPLHCQSVSEGMVKNLLLAPWMQCVEARRMASDPANVHHIMLWACATGNRSSSRTGPECREEQPTDTHTHTHTHARAHTHTHTHTHTHNSLCCIQLPILVTPPQLQTRGKTEGKKSQPHLRLFMSLSQRNFLLLTAQTKDNSCLSAGRCWPR